jgi:hypothetical protein
MAATGEDLIVTTRHGYAANVEKAESAVTPPEASGPRDARRVDAGGPVRRGPSRRFPDLGARMVKTIL